MFGVKLKERRDLIEGLARALILSGQNKIGHQDQASLDRILWPVAKYDVVKWLLHLQKKKLTLIYVFLIV
jgi:ABC-type antimicrobial peptide transport system ATPase subunit